MRYASFEIRNFKGIKNAKIILPKEESTAVALIGLNESGKTTILQAIYSFSPNDESKVLFERDRPHPPLILRLFLAIRSPASQEMLSSKLLLRSSRKIDKPSKNLRIHMDSRWICLQYRARSVLKI
ncbi:MAG: AAA family ATPase [Erythrobacter sp.]